MKKNKIEVGGLYTAKVSDRIVKVRIDSANTNGGWNATNTATGKRIRIKSAQRLRSAAKKAETHEATEAGARGKEKSATDAKAATKKTKAKKADGKQKPKRTSALDAAAEVLKKASKPLRSQEMITAMAEQGLWTSPGGKTPHATLYAAIIREIRDKGEAARFRKIERGQFEFNAA
jgi:hypothetical protein